VRNEPPFSILAVARESTTGEITEGADHVESADATAVTDQKRQAPETPGTEVPGR